jgi:uncharacterized protein (TIGR03067 family)
MRAAQENIQGTWVIVSVERGGEEVPEEEVRKESGSLVFAGDQFRILNPAGKVEFKGTFKLDPGKDPRELDLLVKDGQAQMAIYRLDGDRLTLCHPEDLGAPRPREFASEKAAKTMLTVLKRKK